MPLVLNVDDFEPQLYVRSAVLRSAGFEVAEARSGREALSLVRERRPSLVVLDVHLPDIDGLEVCRQIKSDPETALIPVLHVSATCIDPPSRVKGLENGADGYLLQAVEPAELIAYARSLLRFAEAQAEARRAEQARLESTTLLRAISDGSSDAIFAKDLDGRITFANPATLALVGKPADQVIGKTDVEVLDDKDAARQVRENDRRIMAGGVETEIEERVPLPDGTSRIWLSHKAPYRNARGEVVGLLGISRDVTDRRRVEERLQASEARYRALFEHMGEGFALGEAIFDESGAPCDFRFLEVNAAFVQQTGLPRQILGRSMKAVLPGLEPYWAERYCSVAISRKPLRFVDYNADTDRHYDVFCYSPAPGQFAIIFRDVTDDRRAIEERERLYRQAEEANRLKDDFLATLSHELRTPLTAILGWSRLLEQGGLSPEMVEQAHRTIARNAEAQRQLLTDVLDVSRMISGKMRLEVKNLDVLEIVSLAVASMQPALAAKRLDLEVSSEAVPATIAADPDRLQQIIWNLLSNAVKFTPSGGRITIRLARGASTLDIVVSDSGIGIAPEFVPKLFARFAQADSSASRRYGGLGLGLSIVRHLVELHGGRVFAESAGTGQGATFTVSLPVQAVRVSPAASDPAAAAAAAPAESARVDLAGLQVLVIDDLEDARVMVSTVLRAAGAGVTPAASGEEALRQLVSLRPDVILADIGMPGMDGYTFARKLRTLPEHGHRIPAVALTAFGSESDRAKALAAGFDEHLAKPVLPEELILITARMAGRPVP